MNWSFFGSVWNGAVRTIKCPHCAHSQNTKRRAAPFDATCKRCGKTFCVGDDDKTARASSRR